MYKFQIEDLPKHSNPIFNYCRKLVKGGLAYDTYVEFYRGDMLCLSMKVGEGAGLSTYENEDRCGKSTGHGFKKYEPFPSHKMAVLLCR